MRAVMVMFDTLCRHLLSPYGCDWTHTPNFARLAKRTVTFDKSYVCSMPCMPARREIHTGRPNFLHRSWGPLEPFDDSMPELLKNNGVYTRLVTDHYHYFEDGGATYHQRYSTYDFQRGQEGDPWIGQVNRPAIPPTVNPRSGFWWEQDWINRGRMREEEDQPQSRTFRSGLEFIRQNAAQDKWFLQLETFDPHEPFYSSRKYKDLFSDHYSKYAGRHYDWPGYKYVDKETKQEIEHLRHEYAALLAMCDAKLGDVLDTFDELDLWKDTLLMVCTDHGFLLGERDMLGKVWCPFYQEIAHTPLFVWDPRVGKAGQRRNALVQNIDWAPTLLEFFGGEVPKDMTGKPLRQVLESDTPIRQAGLFGIHGGQVNVTDGRYVYMRAPVAQNQPLFEYTLMPTHMRGMFDLDELKKIERLAEPFDFTKGVKTMKIRRDMSWWVENKERDLTLLYDVESDPWQAKPMADSAIEGRMIGLMKQCMQECEAPQEQYQRLGF